MLPCVQVVQVLEVCLVELSAEWLQVHARQFLQQSCQHAVFLQYDIQAVCKGQTGARTKPMGQIAKQHHFNWFLVTSQPAGANMSRYVCSVDAGMLDRLDFFISLLLIQYIV